MKKILGLLAMIFIMGCDDGDMTFQTFNFTDVQAGTCEDGIVYKINGNEVLVLDIDPVNFLNAATPDGEPRVVNIAATGANTVRYYRYGSDVSGSAICNPTLAQPPVETWIANGGTLIIESDPNYEDEDENDDEEPVLTGYTHTIFIESLSFSRNDETIIIQENEFGSYVTNLEYSFNFNSEGLGIERCEAVNPDRLFITSQNEVLRMDLDPMLFPNAVTEPGTPRTQILNGNQIRFDIYANSSFSDAHTCDPDNAVPNPLRTGIWRAISGSVEVTTTSPVAGQYIHQIKLVDVTFQNVQNLAETFTRDNYTLPDYIVTE